MNMCSFVFSLVYTKKLIHINALVACVVFTNDSVLMEKTNLHYITDQFKKETISMLPFLIGTSVTLLFT